MINLNPSDHQDLTRAVNLLENPSFAAKVTNLIGAPVEKAIMMLPDGVSEKLVGTTQKVLSKVMDLAVSTLDERYRGWVVGPDGGVTHLDDPHVAVDCGHCQK